VVFHDILTDIEMNFLKEESRPNLSRNRTFNQVSGALAKHEFSSGERRRVVHKTVQHWLPEVDWPSWHERSGASYKKINFPILWELNKKITLATQFHTKYQTSGTMMQVTNYGLGGLCEPHMDPVGWMEGIKLGPEYNHLSYTGDMIGTFMAWLSDTEAGGNTIYCQPGHEGKIKPEKGAAAFWYDILSDGYRDLYSLHGGCPVLMGSKWILNKWLYMFDNFKKFPCKLARQIQLSPPSKEHYF